MQEGNPYAVGEAPLDTFKTTQVNSHPYFVVSRLKYLVMTIGTLGVYNRIWMYLHWARVKRATGGNQWPIMRALFPVFFVHSLLSAAEDDLRKRGIYSNDGTSLATSIVVLMIASVVVDRVASQDGAPSGLALVALALLVLQAYLQSVAQRTLNLASNDPEGVSNSRFTIWNMLWLLAFMVLWAFALLGILIEAGMIEIPE